MADTSLGNYPKVQCSDCGGGDVCFAHWGPLVPADKKGYFDADCFQARQKHYRKTGEVLPLGYKLKNKPA